MSQSELRDAAQAASKILCGVCCPVIEYPEIIHTQECIALRVALAAPNEELVCGICGKHVADAEVELRAALSSPPVEEKSVNEEEESARQRLSLWNKLGQKRYREEFVGAILKRGIPFHIRAMMDKRNLSQERLAELSDLTQGVISRAVNPSYGNLALNTIIRIAAGLDVAFIGRFVPFSDFVCYAVEVPCEDIPTFEEEDKFPPRTKPKGL